MLALFSFSPTEKNAKCSWLGVSSFIFLSPAWKEREGSLLAEAQPGARLPLHPCTFYMCPSQGQRAYWDCQRGLSLGQVTYSSRGSESETPGHPAIAESSTCFDSCQQASSYELLCIMGYSNSPRLPLAAHIYRWGEGEAVMLLPGSYEPGWTQIGLTRNPGFFHHDPFSCLCSDFLVFHINSSFSAFPSPGTGRGIASASNACVLEQW